MSAVAPTVNAVVFNAAELRVAAAVVDAHLEAGCTTIAALAHAARTVTDMRAHTEADQ